MNGWIGFDATGTTLDALLGSVPRALGLAMILAGTALILALLPKVLRSQKRLRLPSLGALLAAHYVKLVFAGVAIICAWAAWIGLLRVPLMVGGLLDDLRASTADAGDPEQTRRIVFALAAVLAVITIIGALVAQAIRIWINERAARNAEASLVTGLISTAVEGLGAEKKVSRIGRPVTLAPREVDDPANPGARTIIEWQGESLDVGNDWIQTDVDWQTFEFTAPSLEVRIGAILTLERIARDNPGDHIRVMDILCAYIRGNAPARDIRDHDLGEWPGRPTDPSAVRTRRAEDLSRRHSALQSWIEALPDPRTDIQVALDVIGRRAEARKLREEAAETRGGEAGYRLDLRRARLYRCDLSPLDFRRARFGGVRLDGANLGGARLEGGLWRGEAGEGGPRLGAAGRGGPLRNGFPGSKLGRCDKRGITGPVCRSSRRARVNTSSARSDDRQRSHAAPRRARAGHRRALLHLELLGEAAARPRPVCRDRRRPQRVRRTPRRPARRIHLRPGQPPPQDRHAARP